VLDECTPLNRGDTVVLSIAPPGPGLTLDKQHGFLLRMAADSGAAEWVTHATNTYAAVGILVAPKLAY